jgi:hypothetical protein
MIQRASAARRRRPPLAQVAFMIAGLFFLWAAQNRLATWQEAFAGTARPHTGTYLQWMALAALAGACLGAAAILPAASRHFRARSALGIAILPLLVIAHYLVVWHLALANEWDLPSWMTSIDYFFGPAPQMALGVMLGAALPAGFAGTKNREFAHL